MSDVPELPFTGERYVPGIHGQIELEHRHRYYMARQLAAGKRVLDIACGEGYGTDILAATAACVVGVDIDAQTVEHARKRYVRENLSFAVGACEQIPLPDRSVDLVVSFETLEHTDQHEQMLSEITRVLTLDGVLLVSTPNRAIYRAAGGLPNPFHMKELELTEFTELLGRYFANTQPFGQRVAYGSLIAHLEGRRSLNEFLAVNGGAIWGPEGPENWWRYFLMAASNAVLPEFPVGLVGFAATEDYENGVITRLYNSEVHLQSQLTAREHDLQELARSNGDMRAELGEKDLAIVKLQTEINQRDETIASFQDQAYRRDELVKTLQEQQCQYSAELERLTALSASKAIDLADKERDLGKLAQLHSELRRELDRQNLAIADLRAEAQKRDEFVRHLQEQQRQSSADLEYLRAASSWKTAELEAKTVSMVSSLSWRLTRPVREVQRWVRRLIKGLKILRKQTRPVRYFLMAKKMPKEYRGRKAHISQEVPKREATQWGASTAAFAPCISVIVPNYNHAKYLRDRLDSIYHQSYPNIEVILLDDASADGSVAILKEYAERYRQNTRLICNTHNSGSPFAQWKKGMEMARGELIWIAESDDNSESGFLSELVPMFTNSAVTLAFCKTLFIDDGGKVVWSTDEYLHNVAPELWQRSFVMGAATLVPRAWVAKNIIPNVGSAIFRKPLDLSKLCALGWTNFKVCGDWIFYLNICRGGLVGYSEKPMNLYRLHSANTSVNLHKDERFYREHADVLRFAQQYYHIAPDDCQRHMDTVAALWRLNRPQDPLDFITNEYRELMVPKSHRLNIMICGFALTSGGGETFPTVLANGLRDLGCNVTFCNFNREPTIQAVRKRIRSDIPVVEISDPSQLPQLVDDMKIDVIHTHHAWVDVAVADLLQTNSRCAFICTTHGMYDMMDGPEIYRIIALLEKRVDRFCYAAEKNLKNFPPQFLVEKRFTNIPNAAEIRSISSVSRGDLGIPESAFVVCLISRAIPEKGWLEAIAACTAARNITGRDIHLLLVGNGPESDRLLAKGTEKHVHVLGFRDDVLELFKLADTGLLPSRFAGESFPLVLLECLAAGRPMIATDIGEIKRIMSSSTGPAGIILRLEGGQIPTTQLAESIGKLATDSDLLRELGSRTSELSAKFSVRAVAKGYLSAYIASFVARNSGNTHDILDDEILADSL